MKQVVAIAVNTFKETIRDRVLAVIVVFALIMIAGGLWLGSISLGQQGRMMKDFGLVAVTVFGLIVAVFVAAEPGAQGGREAHRVRAVLQAGEPRRVHHRQVRRPLRHHGRGARRHGRCSCSCSSGSSAGDASGMVLVAVVMIYVQLLAVMAVTIFFSTLGSAILASVLGICVFVAGQLSHNVLALTRLGKNAVTEALSWVVYVRHPEPLGRGRQGRRRR